MNILLTCAGRRGYLVDYFRAALEGSGKIVAANSTIDAAAMIHADVAVVTPSIFKKNYTDNLIDICKKYNISLLVSLFDLELPIIAKHLSKFENNNVKVAVSALRVTEICNDKYETTKFCSGIGIKTPITYVDMSQALSALESGFLEYPLYLKPRYGMGSLSVYTADNKNELDVFYNKIRSEIRKSPIGKSKPAKNDVVIQERARGQEYGLDVVNDFAGNYVTTFVKKKISMRSGETDVAITENVPQLEKIGRKVSESLGHIGNLDIDVFWDGKEARILEMNARLGGHYPFSHIAGANLPAAYISWAENRAASSECFSIQYGVKGLKDINLITERSTK